MRFKTKSLLQVIVFIVSTGLLITLVGLTFSKVRIEDSREYHAVFTDATGLKSRVDVRAAGVTVGSVKSLDLQEDGVKVTFTVRPEVQMTAATELRIRYANLTGDRYLEVMPGTRSAKAAVLSAGSTIGLNRTSPALDLDQLFAGFSPLVAALEPEEINQLASNILGITDGQSADFEAMFRDVADFTAGLAEYDDLIGQTITQVTDAVEIATKEDAVANLLDSLDSLSTKLDRDRKVLVRSLVNIGVAAEDVTTFLDAIRPGFQGTTQALGKVAANLSAEEEYLREVFAALPGTARNLARAGFNGSFFHFFLCGARVKIDLPGEGDIETPGLTASNPRCQHPGGDQ